MEISRDFSPVKNFQFKGETNTRPEIQRVVKTGNTTASIFKYPQAGRTRQWLQLCGHDTTSLVPPLGSDKAKVIMLNLSNRMIFRSTDEADALQSADFLAACW